MARSKSPAPKAASKAASAPSFAAFVGGTINWGDFNVTPLTTPLASFGIMTLVYGTEMMGFQLTGADNKPSFKAANPCTKYMKDTEGCEANAYLQFSYTFFGCCLLMQALLSIATAFRKNVAKQVSLARARMFQCMATAALLLGGKGILAPAQIQMALALQLFFGFWLQNACRGQGAGCTLGERDFHKHGKLGYVYLAFFACNMFYFVNYGMFTGAADDAKDGADVTSAQSLHMQAWLMYAVLICSGDMLFGFEYLNSAELSENLQLYAVALALQLYFTQQPFFANAFNEAAAMQVQVLTSTFLGAAVAFGCGFVN